MKSTAAKSILIVAIILGLLLGALFFGLQITRDIERSKREALELQARAKEAVKKASPLPGEVEARTIFDPAYLQIVFGDNPALLRIVRQQLQQATTDNPALVKGDVAALAVTFEPVGEMEEPSNVVTYLVGDFRGPRPPGFSDEGFQRHTLPPGLYNITNSMLAIVGREIQILGAADNVQSQRELLESMLGGDPSILEAFLYNKQQLRSIIPNPGRLLPEWLSPYFTAIILQIDGSLEGGSMEMIFVGSGRAKVAELAQLVAHWRTLALASIRVRYNSPKAMHLANTLAESQLETRGAQVVIRSKFDAPSVNSAMYIVRIMGRAYHRIESSPEKVRPSLPKPTTNNR